MKAYKYASMMTLVIYIGLMFINPLYVAWAAIAIVTLNVMVLVMTEYYAKKFLKERKEKMLAETLAAISKVKKI